MNINPGEQKFFEKLVLTKRSGGGEKGVKLDRVRDIKITKRVKKKKGGSTYPRLPH